MLPAFQPGAAPALEELRINLKQAVVALPPSWGWPNALPSLRVLDVHAGSITGQLPPEWVHSFLRLEMMTILTGQPCTQTSQPIAPAGSRQGADSALSMHLPEEWPAGFPRLADLMLLNLGLAGPLPPSWQEGGFPGLHLL